MGPLWSQFEVLISPVVDEHPLGATDHDPAPLTVGPSRPGFETVITYAVSRRQFFYQLMLIGAVVSELVLVDFGANSWNVTNRDAAIDDLDGIDQ